MGDFGVPLGELLRIWAEAMVRWLHVIAGIAWIGSSFYFIATDLALKKHEGLDPLAHGETWQVHGGGFYHIVKYLVAPARLPDQLTWFKWEAYTTWASGMALLILVYYLGAELYLIELERFDVSPLTASGISFAFILLGWLAYDQLCKSPLGAHPQALMLTGFAAIIALALWLPTIFSDRGAFMMLGAMLGTVMVANVAHIIIPGQRKVVASLRAGEAPDPEHGRRAKQRSVHNNYLTLPVVFVMIGGHYPLVFATEYAWVIFGLVVVMGVLIRHFFNTRHQGLPSPWWTWGATAAAGLLAAYLSASGPNWAPGEAEAAEALAGQGAGVEQASLILSATGDAALTPPALRAAAHEVVATHCIACHAAEPAWVGVPIAPRGLRLETAKEIEAHRFEIAEQAAWSRAMPPGNITAMTPEERFILAMWARAP